MTKKTKRIEFYKIRSFGQRMSAASDFLQVNIKVLFKNCMLAGIPFALIMGFFTNNYIDVISGTSDLMDSTLLPVFVITSLISLGGMAFVYSVTASIMLSYHNKTLTPKTSISDLEQVYPNTFKTFILFLFIILAFSLNLIFMVTSINIAINIIAFTLFVFLVPLFTLIFYPVYFEELSIGDSISKGFRIAYRNWGTNFLMLIVVSILTSIIQYAFLMPFYFTTAIKLAFSSGGVPFIGSIFGFLGSVFVSLGIVLSVPVVFVMFAFQYFGIREEEEGISLIAKIDEFENL